MSPEKPSTWLDALSPWHLEIGLDSRTVLIQSGQMSTNFLQESRFHFQAALSPVGQSQDAAL
jgi:hypothetical protein